MAWSLRQLDIFIAIVEENGFSAAGEKLRLAQPAVSIAVRKLEDSLGVRLLERPGRGITLTREGLLFLRRARAIRNQIAETELEMTRLRALESGHMTIGAPPMVAGYLLPGLIETFLARHPGVRIKVVQSGAEQIADKVRGGEVDLGFVADWRMAEELETFLIEHHPMAACVPPRSPLARVKTVSWKALFEQPLVLFPKGFYQRARVDEAAARLGVRPNIVLEAESVELIAAMVRAGRGVSTMLAATARAQPGILSRALPPEAMVPVSLCRRAGMLSSHAADAFCEMIRSRAGGKQSRVR